MKLTTFHTGGTAKVGVVSPDSSAVLDLAVASRRHGYPETPFASMLSLIDAGEAGLSAARRLMEVADGDPSCTLDIDTVELLAPIPEPRQMRDFLCYPTHIKQAPEGMRRLGARLDGAPPPKPPPAGVWEPPAIFRQRPIFYITNRLSVAGPGSIVKWPPYSSVMDFELELGMILGKGGCNIREVDAGRHIFGYTIFNDFSARDTQREEMQGMLGPAKSKSFDGSNVLGPWIVTADEIPDPQALGARARVNGETWFDGDTGGMLHSFEQMIAYVSLSETLVAGEVFGSGTLGNGCGLELGRFLADGDVVELEIENVGVLANTVREWR